jgi:enoyl-CoA hydratase/carnithine racemase
MSFQTILFEVLDRVAWVTLNRPEVRNAYNMRMRDELHEVLTAVRDDSDIRVLVLRGAGTAFCAGADLTEFGTAPSPTEARRIRFARDNWALLHGLPIPTIASLHGYVLGSGLELALFCDMRLAAEDVQLGLPEASLGLIPAAGGTQTLPRVCGPGVALDLLLTGRRVPADEALHLGLVSRVVPAEALARETAELAGQLANLDGNALAAIKRAVYDGLEMPLEHGLRLEADLAAELRHDEPR